jgi:choline dehydrogenase-like flavoprotein
MRSGLPNRNDRLGRDITFTLERVAYGLLDARRSANDIDTLIGSFSSTVVKTFYTYSESGAASKGGKFSIYDGKNVELAHRRRQQLALAGADVESFLAREAKGQMSIKISWKGESDVSDSKYLSVDSGRTVLHYRPAIADVDRHRAVEAQMNLIAESLLAESLHMQPVPSGADLISAHHHGGAIFSDDPSKAVVSPDGELLEAAGVYVADGSIMPTSGATNSSLTVMANARRIARCLIERLEGS